MLSPFRFKANSMTVYIRPMSEFPYDVNSREATYFDRNKQQVLNVRENHFCVAYEGRNYALSTWAHKQSKGLSNMATFFSGETTEEKRQNLWHQIQTRTLPKRLARFYSHFSKDGCDLYLWYISEYDRPTAELIKRFLDWYANQ